MSPVSRISRATPLPTRRGKPLAAGVARDEAQVDLGLAEPRRVGGQAQRARHRQLAAAAEREAVDRRDHGLAELFDRVEDLLTATRVFLPATGDNTASSLMSAPATNDFSPAPVSTIARTSASFFNDAMAPASSVSVCVFRR